MVGSLISLSPLPAVLSSVLGLPAEADLRHDYVESPSTSLISAAQARIMETCIPLHHSSQRHCIVAPIPDFFRRTARHSPSRRSMEKNIDILCIRQQLSLSDLT